MIEEVLEVQIDDLSFQVHVVEFEPLLDQQRCSNCERKCSPETLSEDKNKEDVFVVVQQVYLVEEQGNRWTELGGVALIKHLVDFAALQLEAKANGPIRDYFEVMVEPFVNSSQYGKNEKKGKVKTQGVGGVVNLFGVANMIARDQAILHEDGAIVELGKILGASTIGNKKAIIKDIASLIETGDREEKESHYKGVVVECEGLGIIGKKERCSKVIETTPM
ncbi:hypothetical protein V6N13_108738 [Hibiscus sabdariffa]